MKGNQKHRGNVTPLVSRATIREQAARWLVRLDSGQLSNAELVELRRWAAMSELHQATLRELAKGWDQMDILAELAELFPIAPDDTAASRTRRHYAGGLALAAVLVLGSSLVLRPAEMNAPAIASAPVIAAAPAELLEINSVTGEQKVVTLTDGSVIRLNTRSRVRVNYTAAQRHVILLQGEANFAVAKDASRPFVVEAGSGLVEAVGTAFNIELVGAGSEVTVTEGKVKVYSHGENRDSHKRQNQKPMPVMLEAGGSVLIGKSIGAIEQVGGSDLERKLAWQQGSLIFKGETLERALAEVSRYTDQDLVIVDPTIRDLRIGGHFKTNDIDGLLDTLGKSFDLTIKPRDGQPTLVSRK